MFALDGSSNEVGGRPEMQIVNHDLPNAGKSKHKSALKFLGLFRMAMNDKPLPFLIVMLSKAKYPELSANLDSTLHQVEGIL